MFACLKNKIVILLILVSFASCTATLDDYNMGTLLASIQNSSSTSTSASTTTPSFTATPAMSSSIIPNTTIVIRFNRSINTASCTANTGTMGGSYTPGFTTTSLTDDTLTLSAASWNVGTIRTLILSCDDTEGNTIPVNLVYNVFNGIVYASSTGNDGFSGLTPAQAVATLPTALGIAVGAGGTQAILVSQGTFNLASELALPVGISLQGSYNAAYTTQNLFGTPTTIIAGFTNDGSIGDPAASISIDGSLNLISGLHVIGPNQATSSSYVSALNVEPGASPLIIASQFISSTGDSSYGIFVATGGSPVIANVITWVSEGTTEAAGIYTFGNGVVRIRNSIIAGTRGGGSTSSYGIRAQSSLILFNNTIHAGNGAGTRVGINYWGASGPTVQNNIIRASSVCVQRLTATQPVLIRNNNLDVCPTYYDNQGTPVTDLNSTIVNTDDTDDTLVNLANISVNPGLVNYSVSTSIVTDFMFAANPPCSVTQGGADLSAIGPDQFANDISGITRSVSWSMGAFEFNGACF